MIVSWFLVLVSILTTLLILGFVRNKLNTLAEALCASSKERKNSNVAQCHIAGGRNKFKQAS